MKSDEVTVLNVDGRLLASGPDSIEKSPDNLIGLEKDVTQEIREKITATLAPYLNLRQFPGQRRGPAQRRQDANQRDHLQSRSARRALDAGG